MYVITYILVFTATFETICSASAKRLWLLCLYHS